MKELKKLVEQCKNGDFRPDEWISKISEKTGFGESYVEKVFYGKRFNKKIALEIVRFFNEEEEKFNNEIKNLKK